MNLPKPPRGHMWHTHQNFNTGYMRVALLRKGWRKWMFGTRPVDALTVNYSAPVSVEILDSNVTAMAWTILGHFASGKQGRAS